MSLPKRLSIFAIMLGTVSCSGSSGPTFVEEDTGFEVLLEDVATDTSAPDTSTPPTDGASPDTTLPPTDGVTPPADGASSNAIACGSSVCDGKTQVCCLTSAGAVCIGKGAACGGGTIFSCSSKASCAADQVCCGGIMGSSCSAPPCPTTELCTTDAECTKGGTSCKPIAGGFKACIK